MLLYFYDYDLYLVTCPWWLRDTPRSCSQLSPPRWLTLAEPGQLPPVTGQYVNFVTESEQSDQPQQHCSDASMDENDIPSQYHGQAWYLQHDASPPWCSSAEWELKIISTFYTICSSQTQLSNKTEKLNFLTWNLISNCRNCSVGTYSSNYLYLDGHPLHFTA